MKCKFYGTKRDPKRSTWVTYTCGKCLPCRIKKRSCWALRLQLEALQSISKSYWTLTLKDDALGQANHTNRRETVRRFFDALRAYERRRGNIYPIRFFGCLEFGGQFARPHWHMLIFNLVASYRVPPIYRPGLPRPRIHISQWPHGHIDNGEFNMATVNYVSDYVTDFEHIKQSEPDLQPVPYRTIRPAIGYYGLKRAASALAKERLIISEKPTFFNIGDRKWPIDQWTRNTFMKIFLAEGGQYRPVSSPSYRYQVRLLEQEALLQSTPRAVIERQIKTEQQHYDNIIFKKKKKEAQELAASAIYDNIQAAKK